MNKPNAKSILIGIAVLFGVILSDAITANALTISPPRVELQGNPGETLHLDVTLTNDTKSTQIYYTSFANFEAQGETGSPSFVESKDDLDTWISAEQTVAMKAGQSVLVPVTIKIPKNAEPGGHFASIFWGTTPSVPGGTAVSLGAKVGMLILLSVNGDVVEAGGLVSFNVVNHKFWHATLPVSFEYRFKNDGGDRVKPEGTIRIRDTIYLPAKKLNANPSSGNVLPGSTRKYSVDWLNYERPITDSAPTKAVGKFFYDVKYQWKNFAVGLYSARLNIAYGSQGAHAKHTVFFFVFPWQLVVVMVLVALIVFFGGRKILRRYNRYIIKQSNREVL